MSEVVPLTIDDIMSLRVEVLRKGTPVTHCNYPEDSYDDVVHFGIIRAGDTIATSTWFMKECPLHPNETAMQLKGMAVRESLHGEGLGAQLIDRGLQLAKERDAQIVWARARNSAMGFYERCGFTKMGDEFLDEPTGMPHHIVVRAV